MPAFHQTVDDPSMHTLSDSRYIYIHMGSTEAQGAAPETERREQRRVASAGEREAMRRLVGREYEMRAGERHRDCI